ncbi:MAG: thiamine pyrophosphate-binding protein, partial [Chloroflexi bacterium]|nr:thiamine pyrophosphate-binding protein [Chloroflexota bacterium]
MTTITGGELLLKCLKQEGISVLFGVLDGSFNPFLAKLDEYGMRFVNPRHEAAAAHMAEAWSRIRGEPAVVVGGIGPGAANMVSGIVTAYAEGSPVIAITGQRRRSIIYPDRGGSFQNVDLLGLYRPVTKWSAGVRDWRRLPELIRRAFREALTGRPGPVYLEVPEDVMRGTGDPETVDIWAPAQYRAGQLGTGDPRLLAEAAEMLLEAERPLLHAGAGVSWAEAWTEFVALADHLAAPMTTSLAARGVVPENHPRYFHPLDRAALEAARTEADVVLVVGSRLGELDTWGRPPSWGDPARQRVIQVDADPTAIGLNRPVDLGIVGDAREVLNALLIMVKNLSEPREEHADWARYRRLSQDWQEELADGLETGAGGINPGQMVQIVRDFFPRDAITVQDGGNTSLWSASYNPILAPRSYLYTAKFGHLGTGLPYAIGAKLAAPDRPVYLISGDGAFGFNLQELETAARYRVPIVAIVSCDCGWGMERSSQMFAMLDELVACDLHEGARYDLVAQALGCYGEKVDELVQLRPALERAVASGQPAVIQVMVDQDANLAPPGLVEFGSMV